MIVWFVYKESQQGPSDKAALGICTAVYRGRSSGTRRLSARLRPGSGTLIQR